MAGTESVGGPTVSVCMPMARAAHEVEAALRSVLDQAFGDFELLIGDETGAAEKLVAGLGDPRIRYHRNPQRLGFAQNHVALLDRAEGRYMAVLHDDDVWKPEFLTRMVAILERHPDIGLASCRTVLDRGTDGAIGELWPMPLRPGRHDAWLEVILRHEWFLLLSSTIWRRQVWAGPARRWPELCCGDLQFFLSAAEAGWPLYVLDAVLVTYTLHRGQSGAWEGADNGLAVAEDTLALWDGWLDSRPAAQIALTARQRARWHLRHARALVLAGRREEARTALKDAEVLGLSERHDRQDLRRMTLAVALPSPVVRRAVTLKRRVARLLAGARRR